jgi:hypothetical protein
MNRLPGSKHTVHQLCPLGVSVWTGETCLTKRASGPPKLVEITRISKDRSGSGWACRADQMEQTRTYNIWDAVRAVIIRQFSDDGLPISGKGQSTKTLVDTI